MQIFVDFGGSGVGVRIDGELCKRHVAYQRA